MVAHVNQPDFPSTRPTFNIPPFDLGTYDSIATYKGCRYGRADSLSVGFTSSDQDQDRTREAKYASHRGQPHIRELKASAQSGELSIKILPDSHSAHVSIKLKKFEAMEYDVDFKQLGAPEADVPLLYLARMAPDEAKKASFRPEAFYEVSPLLRWTSNPVLALAPVRTRPRRTYDEFSEEFDPEGDHVPVLLARLWEEGSEEDRATLVEALNEFGESSALYKRIGVRLMCRSYFLKNRGSKPPSMKST